MWLWIVHGLSVRRCVECLCVVYVEGRGHYSRPVAALDDPEGRAEGAEEESGGFVVVVEAVDQGLFELWMLLFEACGAVFEVGRRAGGLACDDVAWDEACGEDAVAEAGDDGAGLGHGRCVRESAARADGVVEDVEAAGRDEGAEARGGACEGPEADHHGDVNAAGVEAIVPGVGVVDVGDAEADAGEAFRAAAGFGDEGLRGVDGVHAASGVCGEGDGEGAGAAGDVEDCGAWGGARGEVAGDEGGGGAEGGESAHEFAEVWGERGGGADGGGDLRVQAGWDAGLGHG